MAVEQHPFPKLTVEAAAAAEAEAMVDLGLIRTAVMEAQGGHLAARMIILIVDQIVINIFQSHSLN